MATIAFIHSLELIDRVGTGGASDSSPLCPVPVRQSLAVCPAWMLQRNL